MLRDYTKMEKILILNITETWLDEKITTDADIENFKTFRSDRKGEIKGVVIDLNEKIEAEKICKLSHRKYEVVAVQISDLKTANIVVYRPPETKGGEFDIIIVEIETFEK